MQSIEAARWRAGILPAGILLIMVLELRDLKAYGTFIIGWRLNYGTERNDTELFLFFPVCLDLNSRGVASLSKRNPRNAVG